jgi:3,4-dihydroxy 2-butanone 4-phosphate synthase
LKPAAVICELMTKDGEMLRSKAAKSYARRHGFPVLTIAELVAYRTEVERAAA